MPKSMCKFRKAATYTGSYAISGNSNKIAFSVSLGGLFFSGSCCCFKASIKSCCRFWLALHSCWVRSKSRRTLLGVAIECRGIPSATQKRGGATSASCWMTPTARSNSRTSGKLRCVIRWSPGGKLNSNCASVKGPSAGIKFDLQIVVEEKLGVSREPFDDEKVQFDDSNTLTCF